MPTGMRPRPAPGWSRLPRLLRAATAVAAAIVLAGCASGHQPGALPGSARPPAAAHPARSASPVPSPVPSPPPVPLAERTAEHWGSFFDDVYRSADRQDRPATMILPGAIAAVGSSNAAQYALLADGSLGPGAWAARASSAMAWPAPSPGPSGCSSRPG